MIPLLEKSDLRRHGILGDIEGSTLGWKVGSKVGSSEGFWVGFVDGVNDGSKVGVIEIGSDDGSVETVTLMSVLLISVG